MHDLKDDAAKQIRETDQKTYSKMFDARLRLQKQPNAAMPKKGEEYGNYERYSQNSVTEENEQGKDDWGDDTFLRNYNNMIRKLNIDEGDRIRKHDEEQTFKSITDETIPATNLMDEFNAARRGLDY
jgi:hypothetical protein